MPASPLARKLHLKPGMKLAVVGAPPGYLRLLEPLPEGVHASTALRGKSDVVQAFVRTDKELARRVPALKKALAAGGTIWICYPKLSSASAGDLSRDVIWKALVPHGLRPVAQVAIDETWTGKRFKVAG
jgi:hypothetical protein